MSEMKYLEHQGIYIYIYGKRRIPKKCRTGNICFTSVSVIGDRLFSSIRNNHNHVRKYERYLLLVITTLGTNVIGRGTFFYDGIKIYNLGLRSCFE